MNAFSAKPSAHNRSNSNVTTLTNPKEVGRVLSVGSSVAMVSVNKNIISQNQLHLVQLGTILSIVTHNSIVVAMVSSIKVGALDDEGMHDGCIMRLNMLGEITTNKDNPRNHVLSRRALFSCFKSARLHNACKRP